MHDHKALGIPDSVYALQFSSSAVKVGRTKSYERRLYEHTKQAAERGETVTGEWRMFVNDSYNAELQLMAFAKSLGGVTPPRKYEWFDGVDFDALVELATHEYGDYETWAEAAMVATVEALDWTMAGVPSPSA